eukprot:UN23914
MDNILKQQSRNYADSEHPDLVAMGDQINMRKKVREYLLNNNLNSNNISDEIIFPSAWGLSLGSLFMLQTALKNAVI